MRERSRIRPSDDACGEFRSTAEFVGKKWNAAVLMAMELGASRFSEIRAGVQGISSRLLTARLRELTAAGLVIREVTPTMPVQVRYTLTPAGTELIAILHELVVWSRAWRSESAADVQGLPARANART